MSGKPPINVLTEILREYNEHSSLARESLPHESLYHNGHDDGIANIKPQSMHHSYLIGWTKARRFQFGLSTGSFGICDVEYQKLTSRSSLDGFWDGLNLVDPIMAKVVGYQSESNNQPILLETDRTMNEPDYKLGYEAGLRFLGGLVQSSQHLELESLADGQGYQDLLSALAIPTYNLKQEKIEEYQKDPRQYNTTAQVFARSLNRVGVEKVLAALSFPFTTGNEELGSLELTLPPEMSSEILSEALVSVYQRFAKPSISPLPSPKYPAEEPEDETGWESLDTKPSPPKPVTRTRPSITDAVSNSMPIGLILPKPIEKREVVDLPLDVIPSKYLAKRSEETKRLEEETAWDKFDADAVFNLSPTVRYSV